MADLDNRSPFDKQPAEGSRETVERQLARQERGTPSRHDGSGGPSAGDFSDLLGRAVLDVWGDMPRDLQEAIFETATRDAPDRRAELAKLLHERHPRTEHPPG